MNDIGFGIFCFGEEYYYKGTVPVMRIFNRELSQQEVTLNFESYRNRFSI
jgi:hypothetical protein